MNIRFLNMRKKYIKTLTMKLKQRETINTEKYSSENNMQMPKMR